MTIQLDLFLDSQSVMLTNEVIAALLARDVRRAQVAVNRLRQHDPESPSLAALERLAEGLARWSIPVDDADAIDSAHADLLTSKVTLMVIDSGVGYEEASLGPARIDDELLRRAHLAVVRGEKEHHTSEVFRH